MSVKLPWLPFYGRDFYLDEKVRRLSLRQEAIYMRLLWHQWEEGSIPDVATCQRFPEFRVTFLEDRTHPEANAQGELDAELEYVHLTCFQTHPTLNNRFANPRLEAVRAEQLEKTERLHNRAVKGGQALAQLKQSLSQPQAELKPSVSSAIQSQKQIKKKIHPDNPESVMHTSEDREGKGFTPMSSLVDTVVKHAQNWPKEIP